MLEQLRTTLTPYNPKTYAKVLAKCPELSAWVHQQTDKYSPKNLNERLYILLKSPPNKNACGAYPGFNSYVKGYRSFCGPKSSCECSRAAQSAKLKTFHQLQTQTDKTQTLAKMQATCVERYGVKNPAQHPSVREKMQATCVERYSAETSLGSAVVQEKIKATCVERYGVEYPFQCAEIISKAHATLHQRYGQDFLKPARQAFLLQHNNQNPFVVYQEEIKNAIRSKYDVDHPMQSTAVKYKTANTLESRFSVRNPVRCQYEEELANWLDSLGVSYLRNKKIKLKTVDFLIEDRIAIEFNGLYAHSQYRHYGKKLGIDKKYHHQKLKDCEQLGIRLFTVFEDEWNSKKDTIKNQILISLGLGKTGVAARKTKVAAIDRVTALGFLQRWHLQGGVASSVYLGCYAGDTLIAVMSLLKKSQTVWDLNRYASDHLVHPGVFSKILKFFERNYHCETITSFSDNRWSQGAVYVTNGFTLDSEIDPDYFVTDYQTRQHKFNWRKARIAKRFGIDVSNKTELELTLALKWDRIWDCGKKKWIKHIAQHNV